MSTQPERPIRIELNITASQPELLEGLDSWLRLGLLSDAQVRQMCQQYLSSPLPQPSTVKPIAIEKQESAKDYLTAQAQRAQRIEDEDEDEDEDSADDLLVTSSVKSAGKRSLRSPGLLQSLMAELSVRWLLFLGVFMVVVSSGVLAASQWEKFPPAGQYLVLFAYTAIFWGVSRWTAPQPNLRLTAETLRLVTLLLVPLNFWAMDGFGLWRSLLGWVTVPFCTGVLSRITLLEIDKSNVPTQNSPPSRTGWFPLAFYLLPCYLHWGWGWSAFPLIAVYLGILGTSVATISQTRQGTGSAAGGNAASPIAYRLLQIYATGVLLFRAIFLAHVHIAQLGLAIGISGWLLWWLSQEETRRSTPQLLPWQRIGGGLLILGWLVSVGTQPGQAIAVSILGLWLLADRLRRFWHRADLVGIFLIGLQAFWLIRQIIPPVIRSQAIATGTQLTSSQQTPWVLLGLTLFPYVIFMGWLTDWLYRQPQPNLGKLGDKLTLGLGIVLTLLSLPNPNMRSLNLLASLVTLAIVTQRRWTMLPPGDTSRIPLVYLTHITGLLTLGSAIDWMWTHLPLQIWASILLGMMLVEWAFAIAPGQKSTPLSPAVRGEGGRRIKDNLKVTCQRSAWYIGLSLASLSYSLLTNYYLSDPSNPVRYPAWGILWLITPLALTGVASKSEYRRQEASSLSIAGLGIAQWLTLHTPGTRAIAFGVATALMLANTGYLQHPAAAAIAVGFGLGFLAQLLAIGIPGLLSMSPEDWFVAGAIAIVGLWFLRRWLLRQSTPLAAVYITATDGWAIALCCVEILALTTHSLGVYWGIFPASISIIIAIIVTMFAIAYRSGRQPSNLAIYALGWCLELLTAEALGFFGRSLINLAIANIALGLITQLAGDWWQQRTGNSSLRNSWNVMPLLYGILGAVLRWGSFSSGTGLLSMGLAFIAIGIGRRRQEFKPLLYLAMLGISFSAYELLYYQISPLPQGDRFIRMAALGTSIMYAYRVLTPWLVDYLHLTRVELKVAAHLHWGWSTYLLIGGIAQPIKSSDLLGLGAGIFLTGYAIMQGRQDPAETALNKGDIPELWVYLGLLEGGGVGAYCLTRLPASVVQPMIGWGGAIACIGAYFLYFLPWQTWGWPARPWQHAALVFPVAAVLLSSSKIYTDADLPWYISSAIAVGFYIFLAKIERQIRLTYISLLLLNWALMGRFVTLELINALWYVSPPALSALYIAQVDPTLKTAAQKQTRHNLRLVASSIICFVALFTQHWLAIGILSFAVIFAGLAFRVRAFLYVGTLTFLLNAVNQLVILNSLYSLVRWIVGLLVGITLIWIAANFETRREQIATLVQNWISELQQWQ